MTFPTAEDIIHIEDELQIQVGYDKIKAEDLKQQIISNNEKAEKYDLLEKTLQDQVKFLQGESNISFVKILMEDSVRQKQIIQELTEKLICPVCKNRVVNYCTCSDVVENLTRWVNKLALSNPDRSIILEIIGGKVIER